MSVMDRYEEACAFHATNQGLEPLMEVLRAEGVNHRLEQTGGFTMVVTIHVEGGTWGLISRQEWDAKVSDEYMMVWYPGDAWEECEEGETPFFRTPGGVVDEVQMSHRGRRY